MVKTSRGAGLGTPRTESRGELSGPRRYLHTRYGLKDPHIHSRTYGKVHRQLSLDHKAAHAERFCATLWQEERLPNLPIPLLLSLVALLP